MKKVFAGLATGVLFIVFAVSFACAQAPFGFGPGHPGAGPEMEHPIWRDLQQLKIDKGRMEAIREIRGRVLKDTIRKRAELQILSIELRELLGKDPVNMQAVEAGIKQISSLQADMHLSFIKAIEEVKAKLTSEERKRLREIVEAGLMRPRMDCSAEPGLPLGPGKRGEPGKIPPAKAKTR